MANLGNAWHVPDRPEPRGWAGMRDPAGAIVPGTAVTLFSGNRFKGAGAGNQLQDGSTLFFRRAADTDWSSLPLTFHRTLGDNKYYSVTIPPGAFETGDVVQYYLRIAYDDHDTTFLHGKDDASTPTADEAAARAAPFTFTVQPSAEKGRWGPVFQLPNVGIHTSVLPNGLVLMWGRRDNPTDSLDVHECTPFLWDPETGETTPTPQPTLADGTRVNLFCAGHTFLADGRLLVVGGHRIDSDGLSQAILYEFDTNRWTPTAPMTTPAGEEVRRWYPTATTLPNGSVLVLSGSYIDPTQPKGKEYVIVDLVQVWEGGAWKTITRADGTPLNFIGLPLYPRMHVAPDGRVFMSGTNDRTQLLKTSPPGEWTEVGFRATGNRDYCPSVMYDADRVVYIGGGGGNNVAPTAEVEVIDLGENPPQWRKTGPMHFPRRQHNATVLPDGTVLVVGGTRGGGGSGDGFNDLRPGQPVHTPELWDPATESWTLLAAESVDRCYHATTVLLPDATVLSAGGGEYRPIGYVDVPNPPEDSHRDAQVFSPPYLFRGERPEITSAPASVRYGESFEVGTPRPDEVGRVSWVRLPSTTHSFDENQRINFLQFRAGAGGLTVTAPASPDICPPGHYMLFVLSEAGVPSVSRIVQILAAVSPAPAAAGDTRTRGLSRVKLGAPASRPGSYLQVYRRAAEVAETARGTVVVVGITGTCPYGIGACWGGAYEALSRLEGVDMVNPIPNVDDSTAELFLEDERLPALDEWGRRFRSIVNGTYELRGVEVTLRGAVEERDGQLFLAGSGGERPPVRLAPLAAEDKIQWDRSTRAPWPLDPGEALAFETLAATSRDWADGQRVRVTGPLRQSGDGYRLHVRRFGL